MKNWLFLIAIILTLGLILLFVSDRKKKKNLFITKPTTILDQDSIRVKINKYFEEFQIDIKNYELYSFYSRQFNINELQKDYLRKIELIKDLTDLGLIEKEYELGNKYLIKMAEEIIGHENSKMRWGDALNFLHEYKRLKANLDALNQIKNQITDTSSYDNYVNKAEKNIQGLIERTKNKQF